MHERSMGNVTGALSLFETAISLDPTNGYVCHSYGLLEMEGIAAASRDEDDDDENIEHEFCDDRFGRAERLWSTGLKHQPSAALACSLGRLYETTGRPELAREVYKNALTRLTSERERVEVCLAASSLEETAYGDVEGASRLLREAFGDGTGGIRVVADSRAYLALARLGASTGLVDDAVVKRRLREICTKQILMSSDDGGEARVDKGDALKSNVTTTKKTTTTASGGGMAFPVKDGRLFNAWAKLESRANNFKEARRILRLGMSKYPGDHTLLQAAGNVEERLGNVTAARGLYMSSLLMEPSAPTLIAYGLLELRSPEGGGDEGADIAAVRNLFDEALSIDPKHGPAYNAYGNLERRQGNADRAKTLYEDGIRANCTDAPSVYHGLAKLHLSMGEVESARSVLQEGLSFFGSSGSRKNENVAFLAHTLSMIELNCNNNPTRAKAVLEQGLRHRRNSPQLLLAMALCETKLGDEKAARTMFERSLTADQAHAQAWQAFGVMEMKAGNFKNAKTLFECGLKNSPRHGALWQSYGELCMYPHYTCLISRLRALIYFRLITRCWSHIRPQEY
jgi:tetratricopeptide (TPR) repeat protein